MTGLWHLKSIGQIYFKNKLVLGLFNKNGGIFFNVSLDIEF